MFPLLSFVVHMSDQTDRMSQNGLLFLYCLPMGQEGMHLVDG